MQTWVIRHYALASRNLDSTLDNALSSASVFGRTRNSAAAVISIVCATFDDWRSNLSADGVRDCDIQDLEPFLDVEKRAARTVFLRLFKPSWTPPHDEVFSIF